MHHQVGNQFHGALEVRLRKHAVERCALFGGVGVEFAAHGLHAIENVPRATMCGALEYGMLHEVRQSEA